MQDFAPTGRPNVVPTLRYRDGNAAIAFLTRALGFREHKVFRLPDGAVGHAELVHGRGMVMLGSAANNEFHRLVQSPLESGGIGSQSAYIVVADVDAHCRTAVAAGAEIVIPLADQPHGGRAYSCRDPEGHVWNVGSYDPWAEEQAPGSSSSGAALG